MTEGNKIGDSLLDGLYGLGSGFTLGTIGGMGGGIIEARKLDINPWTGRSLTPKTPVYDFTPDPWSDNVKLYRGTSGSENGTGFLFMTDNPEYAQSYVRNGGKIIEVTIPRSTLNQMIMNGDVTFYKGLYFNGTQSYNEYEFKSSVKCLILNR